MENLSPLINPQVVYLQICISIAYGQVSLLGKGLKKLDYS